MGFTHMHERSPRIMISRLLTIALLAVVAQASVRSWPTLVEHLNTKGGKVAFLTEKNYLNVKNKLPAPRTKPETWTLVTADADNGVFDLVMVPTENDAINGVWNASYVAAGISTLPKLDENDKREFHHFEGGPMNMRTMFTNDKPVGAANTAYHLSDAIDVAITKILQTTSIKDMTDAKKYDWVDAFTCDNHNYLKPARPTATDDLLKNVLDKKELRIACHDANWDVSGTYHTDAPEGVYPSIDRMVADEIAKMYGLDDLTIKYVKVTSSVELLNKVMAGTDVDVGSSYMLLNGGHNGKPRKTTCRGSCTFFGTQNVMITSIPPSSSTASKDEGWIIGVSITAVLVALAIVAAALFIVKLRNDRNKAYAELRQSSGDNAVEMADTKE